MSRVVVRSIEPSSYLPPLIAAAALSAAIAIGTTATYAQDAEEPVASPAASPAAAEATVEGIDGTWTINTEIGSFEGTDELRPFSNSWVGFRVAEVLQNIGEADAVGRTPVVSGALEAKGAVVESALIEADLSTIRSDKARRDSAIQRALQTGDFPTATFESSGPVDLGVVPVDGEPFSASVPGSLTIHGVSQDVEFDLTGQKVGDVVVVVGTLPLDFTTFGITMPTAPVVVSVEDSGDLEWQLFFDRGA